MFGVTALQIRYVAGLQFGLDALTGLLLLRASLQVLPNPHHRS